MNVENRSKSRVATKVKKYDIIIKCMVLFLILDMHFNHTHMHAHTHTHTHTYIHIHIHTPKREKGREGGKEEEEEEEHRTKGLCQALSFFLIGIDNFLRVAYEQNKND